MRAKKHIGRPEMDPELRVDGLSITLPKKLKRDSIAHAYSQGKSISGFIKELLEKEMEKVSPPPPNG